MDIVLSELRLNSLVHSLRYWLPTVSLVMNKMLGLNAWVHSWRYWLSAVSLVMAIVLPVLGL